MALRKSRGGNFDKLEYVTEKHSAPLQTIYYGSFKSYM